MPSRITRIEGAGGIPGDQWHPALVDGQYELGQGEASDIAKRAESRILVATEDEAIELLQTGDYWIRMTTDGATGRASLIAPSKILVDGQPIDPNMRM